MGHTRLGAVPKTRKWNALVEEVAGSAAVSKTVAVAAEDVQRIATATLDATQNALERSISDPGVRHTFYLLTQIALASRSVDWKASLAKIGIHLPADASLFELTAEMQDAVDQHLRRVSRQGTTDVSEIAQQAAGEAIGSLAGPFTISLFGASSAEVQNAVRALSTKKGFGELGQRFFGRFIARFLNFYLSRITASVLGTSRVQQVGDITQFNDALKAHCDQSARIVRDFCAEWYSKTEYQSGIDSENSSRFLAVALRKLRSELEQQKKGET